MSTSPSREYFKKKPKAFLWHLLGFFLRDTARFPPGIIFLDEKNIPIAVPTALGAKLCKNPLWFSPDIFFKIARFHEVRLHILFVCLEMSPRGKCFMKKKTFESCPLCIPPFLDFSKYLYTTFPHASDRGDYLKRQRDFFFPAPFRGIER